MAKIKEEAQRAVETAVEFEKLDMLKQESFELAIEILKRFKKIKEVEEKEEENHEESD